MLYNNRDNYHPYKIIIHSNSNYLLFNNNQKIIESKLLNYKSNWININLKIEKLKENPITSLYYNVPHAKYCNLTPLSILNLIKISIIYHSTKSFNKLKNCMIIHSKYNKYYPLKGSYYQVHINQECL
jgi:hypothetical protein